MSLKARFYIKTVSAKSTVRTQKIFHAWKKAILKFHPNSGRENSKICGFLKFLSKN